MVTSLTDSPTEGTLISTVIGCSLDVECAFDDGRLLAFMTGVRTSRGRGCRWTRDAGERKTSEQPLAKIRQQVPPGAHVVRLFLDPENRCAISIRRERRGEMFVAQRIQLLHAQNRYVLARLLFA